jgi:hypothetical protein
VLALSTAAQANDIVFDIQGDVPLMCEGINNSIAAVETVDLTTTDPQTLGSINYKCNAAGGFQRTISSANAGLLIRAGSSGGSANSVAYELGSGGGSGLGLAPTQLTTPVVTNLSGSTAFIAGQTASVSFSLPSLPDAVYAGTYSDTVTVNITAN